MTNFQLITQNTTTLDDFISAIVDDALAAEGCSMELKLPYELQTSEDGVFLQWKEWLEQEAEDECIYLPGARTIERWRKRGEDDG